MTAGGVVWDLSPLYAGPDDPRIAADGAEAAAKAAAFHARYAGRVAALEPAELAAAIAEYEAIEELGRRPSYYASLLFAANAEDPVARRLAEKTREANTVVANELTAFELELKRLDDARFAVFAADPLLADCRHWMASLRREKPYALSEAEERLHNQKNLAGRDAFSRLFDELTSSFRFRVPVDGVERELSGEETLALLHEPDPDLRARAQAAFLGVHARHGLVLTNVFNALLYDHRIECELRGYPDVVTPTHLENDVRPQTVEAMMTATERHYPLAREYYRLKADLLGLPRLRTSDVYAPLAATTQHVPFEDARALVLDAFASVSPRFADLGRDFFTERWIDAAPRPGKRLGAFCASLGPRTNPNVLMSFTDVPRDVATLAHELGHGIHDRLASVQRPVNYQPPLVLAETASTFAEITLMRTLLARETSPDTRRSLVAAKLDDTMATVFRQNVLTRFEMAAHARRRDGALTADDLGDLWTVENARLYGASVEQPPEYRWGWSYIPHFIHSRFYCYAYVFGELLVLALYQRWLDEGDAFLPGYFALLEAGGSEAPDVLLARMGIDIDDPAFWERGFAVIADLVEELRTTIVAKRATA
jgi:oligoendopeptidase F